MRIFQNKIIHFYKIDLSLYKVNQYEFVMDRRRTEKNMLKTFNIHIETGEWIKYNISNDIMKCVRSNHWKL